MEHAGACIIVDNTGLPIDDGIWYAPGPGDLEPLVVRGRVPLPKTVTGAVTLRESTCSPQEDLMSVNAWWIGLPGPLGGDLPGEVCARGGDDAMWIVGGSGAGLETERCKPS